MGTKKLGGQVGVGVSDSYKSHMRNFHKLQIQGPTAGQLTGNLPGRTVGAPAL